MIETSGGPILSARGISKVFADPSAGGAVEALADVTIEVRRHEFLAIVGPSGCGKSTLLRIIAGLDRPSAGEITVEGRLVAGPGADRGMVFQEYALFPWKTTQRNIEFGPYLKGTPRPERARIAQHFIELVGLGGFEDKFPHQLSGGMRQRAAVARALANQPTVLLMDEPFAAVDAMTRQRLQEEIAAIAGIERMTVIFVTHAIEEAVFLADRVIVLSGRPGEIRAEIEIGLPRPRRWAALLNEPRFVALRDALTDHLHGRGKDADAAHG